MDILRGEMLQGQQRWRDPLDIFLHQGGFYRTVPVLADQAYRETLGFDAAVTGFDNTAAIAAIASSIAAAPGYKNTIRTTNVFLSR
ncbi:MAG: hypothetical protein WBN96_00480 [Gammaproteobacteria bacterium]